MVGFKLIKTVVTSFVISTLPKTTQSIAIYINTRTPIFRDSLKMFISTQTFELAGTCILPREIRKDNQQFNATLCLEKFTKHPSLFTPHSFRGSI